MNWAKAAASAETYETFHIESTMFSLHVIFCAWQAPGNYALDGTPIKMLRMHPTEAWAPVLGIHYWHEPFMALVASRAKWQNSQPSSANTVAVLFEAG